MADLKMKLIEEKLSVCRLQRDMQIPAWALSGQFFSITKTHEELSIVCSESFVPEGVACEKGWRALMVEGPLDFSLIGILSQISTALAEVKISIFAISTYDTDYILIKAKEMDKAISELRRKGYIIEL